MKPKGRHCETKTKAGKPCPNWRAELDPASGLYLCHVHHPNGTWRQSQRPLNRAETLIQEGVREAKVGRFAGKYAQTEEQIRQAKIRREQASEAEARNRKEARLLG